MIVGIDASNIRAGGGVTHLVELLKAADPQAHRFLKVVIWGGQTTLSQIEERPWLEKCHLPELDRNLFFRTLWQCFKLSCLARESGCNVLLVPGGSFAGSFHPIATISQNLLPFEWHELRRYGVSLLGLKLSLLRWSQSHTFRNAEGIIFLSQYAQDTVLQAIGSKDGKSVIIPHGINERFTCPPREQESIARYSASRPFRILYVSIIDMYKHQWHMVEAVSQLRDSGIPVSLELIGPAYPPALVRLKKAISRFDPKGEFVHYLGKIPYSQLRHHYQSADLFLFGSSCENMPNILLEGMAAGLPIACSIRGPMPEVLGDSGVWFDPEKPVEAAKALKEMIESTELRTRMAKESYGRSRAFSWQRCAEETFQFLSEIAQMQSRRKSI